jgi:hypothetical protein
MSHVEYCRIFSKVRHLTLMEACLCSYYRCASYVGLYTKMVRNFFIDCVPQEGPREH